MTNEVNMKANSQTKNILGDFHQLNDDCLSLILRRLDYESLEALSKTNAYFKQRIHLFRQHNRKHMDKVMKNSFSLKSVGYLHRIDVECLNLILKKLSYQSLENLTRTDNYFRKRIELFKRENCDHLDVILRNHQINWS